MSRGEDPKRWALVLFVVGLFTCVLAVMLTIGAIWLVGQHGLGGKLGGTSAVCYIVGIICTLVGGGNRWNWG